jgi:DNA invertase Pin-like site-specific DNA recombinase
MYEEDDDEEQKVDITTLKYVLYARKSTDDPQRQIRSIDDQIDECKRLAERSGIRIVSVLKEEKSAKTPGKRKLFDEMIAGIESGKFDGVLAWNPDRLARNMIEGSHILNLVDSEQVKDLKFVTHYFTNDASGKMLLGISFVMADYYSRNLSQNVTRGVRKGLKEGKSSGTPKHGYIRNDEDGIYRPDDQDGSRNFGLVCDAWTMRKKGDSLKKIATYMNENGYGRVYKEKAAKAGQKVEMSDKILSNTVFCDPFYYGVLIQTDKPIDLRQLEGYDFKPTTDEETYNHIQEMTGRSTKDTKRVVFKPLVEMVYCSYCNAKMYPQTPKSSRRGSDGVTKTKILSYRCDNKSCMRKNKELKLSQSVRGIEIFKFMYEMLENIEVNESDYKKLRDRLVTSNQSKAHQDAIRVHSLEGSLKTINKDIKERSLKIISLDNNSPIYKTNEAHINELGLRSRDLQDEILRLKEQRTNPEEDVMSFEDFLNVTKNASQLLRAADVVLKDQIARLIYLNVSVDSEKVVSYQMKEPFKTYFKSYVILNGRGERT